MTIFVLCTGRCGSTTFARACEHMTNYTVGHETRAGDIGPVRFAFPDQHIEVGNRMAWLLGRLERQWGDRAAYVHLTRDADAVAASFLRRYHDGIMGAYNSHILMGLRMGDDPFAVCLDYIDTVSENIRLFLAGKSKVWRMAIDDEIEQEFARFWLEIGADGDLSAALAEFTVRHNSSAEAIAC